MTEQQKMTTRQLQVTRMDPDPKEGIKMLINQMKGFDGTPERAHDIICEKIADSVPSKPNENEEEHQKMRREMELVTAKLNYEMECRKNQRYELERLALQLQKTHSDLQSMTMQRDGLQANMKTLRRQKCYMVGLLEDLKHRHGQLKQDFEFMSVQHHRARAMLKRAMQERQYWEARCKNNHVVVNSSSRMEASGCRREMLIEEAETMVHPHMNATPRKRNRCDFDDDGHSMPVNPNKQYRRDRAFEAAQVYPVQEGREPAENISK